MLVDGDDMNEPIADAVRSILDGHVVLSRELAHAGHYPAIDVLASVSRLVGEVASPEVRAAGDEVRRLMAAYRDKEDLIAIGAYQRGTDALTDAAIARARRSSGSCASASTTPRPARTPTAACSSWPRTASWSRARPAAAIAATRAPAAPGTPLAAAIPPLSLRT